MKQKNIIFIFLATLIVGLAVVGYQQKNNIHALILVLTMDQEKLSQAMEDNEKELLMALGQEKFDIELTEEQKEGITSGSIDAEQLAKQLMLEGTTEKKDQSNASTSAQTSDSKTSEIDQLLGIQISKMYVLKSSYIGELEGLIQQAKKEYSELPQDQRTESNKQKIMKSKLSLAADLEGACDTQVTAIVDEVQRILRDAGRDTSLADQIMSAYMQEKSLKKAYYLEQLG